MYFDKNGDPPTGYDIISWTWIETNWSIRKVGSFSPDPTVLIVDADQIEWHKRGDSKPVRISGLFWSYVLSKNLKPFFISISFTANILVRTVQKAF